MKLVLVGTVHRDPRGEEALLGLLEEEGPEIVTVEVSPYSIRFRLRHRELLCRPHLPLQVKEFLRLPYEYRAARRYGSLHGTPVLPIDLCGPAKAYLRRTGELLRAENLAPLGDSSLWEALQREYAFARRCWSDPLLARTALRRWDHRRERALAKRVLDVLRHHPRRKVLHIGGWTHMLPVSGSMYHWLRGLSPQRRLLDPS